MERKSIQLLKKLYVQACFDEINAFKPGNVSNFSPIMGMQKEKFFRAAYLTSEILTQKKTSLGKVIFESCKLCIKEFNQNYNLGIILLSAPIIKAATESFESTKHLKKNIFKVIQGINKEDDKLIIEAIKICKPGGLQNFDQKFNILNANTKNIKFLDLVKFSHKYDRISSCYFNNYKEIFTNALPYFKKERKINGIKVATEKIYMKFLCENFDSHILRKHGKLEANIILNKSKNIFKKINNVSRKNNYKLLKDFDNYLKRKRMNPGTCADLTVTTLLIDKITDIVKFSNFNIY